MKLRRIVLDALKARESGILDLSRALCGVKGVDEVDVTVTEVDAKTETVKMVLKGVDIDYEGVNNVLHDNGATLRSIDEISVSRV